MKRSSLLRQVFPFFLNFFLLSPLQGSAPDDPQNFDEHSGLTFDSQNSPFDRGFPPGTVTPTYDVTGQWTAPEGANPQTEDYISKKIKQICELKTAMDNETDPAKKAKIKKQFDDILNMLSQYSSDEMKQALKDAGLIPTSPSGQGSDFDSVITRTETSYDLKGRVDSSNEKTKGEGIEIDSTTRPLDFSSTDIDAPSGQGIDIDSSSGTSPFGSPGISSDQDGQEGIDLGTSATRTEITYDLKGKVKSSNEEIRGGGIVIDSTTGPVNFSPTDIDSPSGDGITLDSSTTRTGITYDGDNRVTGYKEKINKPGEGIEIDSTRITVGFSSIDIDSSSSEGIQLDSSAGDIKIQPASDDVEVKSPSIDIDSSSGSEMTIDSPSSIKVEGSPVKIN